MKIDDRPQMTSEARRDFIAQLAQEEGEEFNRIRERNEAESLCRYLDAHFPKLKRSSGCRAFEDTSYDFSDCDALCSKCGECVASTALHLRMMRALNALRGRMYSAADLWMKVFLIAAVIYFVLEFGSAFRAGKSP